MYEATSLVSFYVHGGHFVKENRNVKGSVQDETRKCCPDDAWEFFLLLVPVVSLAIFFAISSVVILLGMLWMIVENPLRWLAVEIYILGIRIWSYGRLIFMSRQRRHIEYEKTLPVLIELKRLHNRMQASMREPTPAPKETDEQKKAKNDLWVVVAILVIWGLFSGG